MIIIVCLFIILSRGVSRKTSSLAHRLTAETAQNSKFGSEADFNVWGEKIQFPQWVSVNSADLKKRDQTSVHFEAES